MVTKSHTTVKARDIDDELRRCGRCVVRLPNTAIEFEITHRGVEVVANGTRHVTYRQYDAGLDRVLFVVTVDCRWECRATQEGFDGLSYFEVIDKAGDPFGNSVVAIGTDQYGQYKCEQYAVDTLLSPTNNKRKKVLLCL